MTSRGFSAAAIASIVFRCQEADLADRLTLGPGIEIECARFRVPCSFRIYQGGSIAKFS